jgi:hypothetical protein
VREEQERVRKDWQKDKEDADKKNMLGEKLRGRIQKRKNSKVEN